MNKSLPVSRAAEPASSLDSLFTITCSHCGKVSAALHWSETPISGELPTGEFQCPKCGYAFRRQRFAGDPWRRIGGQFKYAPVDLIEIAPRL